MGRPQKRIDVKVVAGLAEIGCKMSEMEVVLGIARDTIERRFAVVIHKGRERAKTSLRRKMWQAAMGGNITMLIFLSKQKQFLGYSDKQELSGPDGGAIEIRDARDSVAAKLLS